MPQLAGRLAKIALLLLALGSLYAVALHKHAQREEIRKAAVALTPGIEGPTISPLHREGWVAVRSMVPRDQAQRVMDELWDLGARGILSTDIHACRL